MNKRSILSVVSFVAWLGGGPIAAAQVPEDNALDALRTRSSVPADDPAIETWITYRLKKLTDDLQVGSEEAAGGFLQAYRTQFNHTENSASFKAALLQQSNQRFAAEFEKGQGLPVAVGLTLARTLADLKDVGTIGGLTAGLQAKGQPAARYTCAKAFAALIPAIQADTTLTKTTIERLRDAGAQESNGLILKRIYEALSYREANLETAAGAMMEIIKGQLRRRAGGAPACDGAEETAFNFLRNEAGNLQAKPRLVVLLAADLRMDVERYLTPGVSEEEKYLIELTIDAAENLLQRVVAPPSPAPSVREVIKKTENRDLNLPLELNKWIGTEQNKGLLNGPPWNVPVGAPIPD